MANWWDQMGTQIGDGMLAMNNPFGLQGPMTPEQRGSQLGPMLLQLAGSVDQADRSGKGVLAGLGQGISGLKEQGMDEATKKMWAQQTLDTASERKRKQAQEGKWQQFVANNPGKFGQYGDVAQFLEPGEAMKLMAGGEPTDDVREYKVAQGQGYQGTFMDYMHEVKKPLVSIDSKPPTGFRYKPDNSLEYIPGGPADPSRPVPPRSLRPTTDQSNAAGFYDRLVEADKVLAEPDVTASAMDFGQKARNAVPFGVGNYLTSPSYQKFDQASRNFVNAVLRKESGAAISESEFENAKQQYFPQPGDTPEKIAQKAQNRATVIKAMHRTAGSALMQGQQAAPDQTQTQQQQEMSDGEAPEGVDPQDWEYMTPEEKALWQN